MPTINWISKTIGDGFMMIGFLLLFVGFLCFFFLTLEENRVLQLEGVTSAMICGPTAWPFHGSSKAKAWY